MIAPNEIGGSVIHSATPTRPAADHLPGAGLDQFTQAENLTANETAHGDSISTSHAGGSVFTREVKGGVVIVDTDDAHWIAERKPCIVRAHASGFVTINIEQKRRMLHRVIMNAPQGVLVDHKNGNFLDNRKSNLRFCTHAENSQNRKIHKTNTSGFKGVSFVPAACSAAKPWVASIKFNGRQLCLGYFPTAEQAARAYDTAAREHHKEFARLNFPKEGEVAARHFDPRDAFRSSVHPGDENA